MDTFTPCYYFIEVAEPYEESIIRVCCTECVKTHKPPDPWFYQGQHGNWEVKCHFCKAIINYVGEIEDSAQIKEMNH